MQAEDALRVARVVRRALLNEFSEREMLRQCKRAAILIDLGLRHLGYTEEDTYPTAGFILRPEYELGHVWNVVYVDGDRYILDVTARQFARALGMKVPAIVWGPEYRIARRFHYIDDGEGPYEYDERDVRPSLVSAVLTALDEEA